MEVQWERMKAHELRAEAGEDTVVIIPVASIEQHGPHMPVMVDTRLGHEAAVRAARRTKTRTLVTPVVWTGLSEHHMDFGGTLSISHETFEAIIRDLIISLSRHGFRKIVIANSHGGNTVATQYIADKLATRLDATIVAARYAAEGAAEIAALLEDQPALAHAEEAETSMMMALEPDLIDTSALDQLGTDGLPGVLGAGKAAYRWRPFQHATGDGVRGKPARASAEKGEKMLEAGANGLAALIDDPATWAPPADKRGAGTGGVAFRDR